MFRENSIETCILSRVKQITSPGWMHEKVLGPGALGRPRGIGWRGRWEGGSGWGIRVNPWLIHVNVWQNPLQYCKVINLQLIKTNGKKKFKWKNKTSLRKNRKGLVNGETNNFYTWEDCYKAASSLLLYLQIEWNTKYFQVN